METYHLEPPASDPRFEPAFKIIKRLQEEGYQAVMAGGCVRDLLMDKQPRDYDIASEAPPGVVENLFEHTVPVGKSFGVIIVVKEGREYDVARFRSEADYRDGRRPDDVTFVGPEEDVKRRDFTVNGLLWDPVREEVLDYVGGVEDIRNERLRTIGAPDDRFSEDYLRMIRTARFAAQTGFQIDSKTRSAVRRNARKMSVIARERILEEVKYLLISKRPARGLRELHQLQLLPHVLQPLDRLTEVTPDWQDSADSIFDHLLTCLTHWQKHKTDLAEKRKTLDEGTYDDEVKQQFRIGLTLICHDLPGHFMEQTPEITCLPPSISEEAKGSVTSFLRELRCSNDTIRRVETSLPLLSTAVSSRDASLAETKKLLSSPSWPVVKRAARAIIDALPEVSREPFESLLNMKETTEPSELDPDPLLDGDDLIQFGLEPGPEFGRLLDQLRTEQLNENITSRQEAIEWLKDQVEE